MQNSAYNNRYSGEKMKNKRKTYKNKKQYKNKSYMKYVYTAFLIGLVVILFGLLNYLSVNSNNCKSYTGCITNLEYDYVVRQPMVTFSIDNEKFYYEFTDDFVYERDVSLFEKLSDEKTAVTLTVTSKKGILDSIFIDGNHVVDVRDDNEIYFDIDKYNSSMLLRRIIFGVLGLFVILFGIVLLIIDFRLNSNR